MPPQIPFKVIFTKEFRAEFNEISDWYVENTTTDPLNLVEEIDVFTQKAANNPERFATVAEKPVYRRIILKKFPFHLFYRIQNQIRGVVFSNIFHKKRERKTILPRLK
jgi:plasmid stabilization system protein ParE